MIVEITLADALLSLRPGAQWELRGSEYEDIVWLDKQLDMPSVEELTAELTRLRAVQKATEYRRERAAAYPPMADYLDAVVKGDTTQMQQYVVACLAVKAKFPKPE